MKPGTNRYHGVGYEYLRRTSMEANQFGNNATGQPRAEHSVDQWGFELDGPLTIPKIVDSPRTFFFLNYTGNRSRSPYDKYPTVPTGA